MIFSDILKLLVRASFYLNILIWLFAFIILLYSLFYDSESILNFLLIKTEYNIESANALFFILIFGLIIGSVWIFIIYLFKNLIDSLISGPLFTKKQLTGFNLIGQLLILITVADAFFLFVFRIIFAGRLRIEFDFFDFWFVIGIGLFFILLSKVFRNANKLKEENELTV
ncbi:DUF2975 domain-containing protein [Salegentibacter sp. HM20]